MIRPFVRESLFRQVANLNRCCRFCRPRPPGPAMPGPAPVCRRRRPTWPGPGPGIIAILWGIHWIHGESYDHSILWRSIIFPLCIFRVTEFWRTFAWAWKKRLMSTNIHSVKWPLPGRHCTAAGGQQPKQPETCLVIVRDVRLTDQLKVILCLFYGDLVMICFVILCHRHDQFQAKSWRRRVWRIKGPMRDPADGGTDVSLKREQRFWIFFGVQNG